MNRFPVSNIEIDYDSIQELWCFYECECLSKREIKRAVYNFVYGHLNRDYFEALVAENARIEVYWHAGWNEPVVRVPSTQGWSSNICDITKELKRYTSGKKEVKQ